MKQGQSKVFLVTGNETLRNKDVFLENLVYHQKLKREDPFLIDLIPHHNCFSGEPKKLDGKSELPAFFEYYTDQDVPCITGERLAVDLKGKKREELLALGDTFSSTFLFGAFPQESEQFYSCIDHIILLIRNDYESSSYLFNLINGLYDKMIEKNMGIIISGIRRLEDAAQLFVKIRDEMKGMIDSSLSFDFLGHLDFNISRITFAKKRNEVYLKVFENDSFHGSIKYISEKLAGLEYFRTKSFFKAVADFAGE